jgi:lipopolysaccharide transport system permease protein
MLPILRSLIVHKALLKDFVVRDLKARYVGSAMGFFWSLVYPVVNLIVFMFVFRFLFESRWEDGGNRETAIVMLAGILVWTAFQETVSRSTNSLIENTNLIQKIVFPSEILTPYLGISGLVNMLIAMPVVLVGVLFFSGVGIGAPLLAVPLLLLLQLVFTCGIGWFFATLNVYLRDTAHLIGVGLTVWMFTTPIFYPPSAITKAELWKSDDEADGVYDISWMLEINPMHWLIDSWRKILVENAWPDAAYLLRFGVVAALVFALGGWFFMTHKRRFADLL